MEMDKLITTTQYAKRHRTSRQWIHNLIKQGRLDAVRIGRTYFIKPNSKISKPQDIVNIVANKNNIRIKNG